MTSSSLFQNSLILRKPGVTIFADIIKIATMFIKTIIKDSRKVKRIRYYVSKFNLYLYFLMEQNLLISDDVSRTQGMCHAVYIFFDLP